MAKFSNNVKIFAKKPIMQTSNFDECMGMGYMSGSVFLMCVKNPDSQIPYLGYGEVYLVETDEAGVELSRKKLADSATPKDLVTDPKTGNLYFSLNGIKYCYNPKTDYTASISPPADSLFDPHKVMSPDGDVYLTGVVGHPVGTANEIAVWKVSGDYKTFRWATPVVYNTVSTQGDGPTGAVLSPEGKLLVGGQLNSDLSANKNVLLEIDPSGVILKSWITNNAWENLFFSNGKLYSVSDRIYRFDLATGTFNWTSQDATGSPYATMIGDTIYNSVISDLSPTSGTIKMFDATTGLIK
jgi:hypothetical protein